MSPHPNNYDPAKHREETAKKEKERVARLQRERHNFEKKINRPFFWKDTSFFRLTLNRIPKNHTLSFMVILKKPIPSELVDSKLERAFGDLK